MSGAGRASSPDRAVEKPSIIGRERVLIEMLTKEVQRSIKRRYDYTSVFDERRGQHFEVLLVDSDGERTGHVARITVTFERMATATDLNTGAS